VELCNTLIIGVQFFETWCIFIVVLMVDKQSTGTNFSAKTTDKPTTRYAHNLLLTYLKIVVFVQITATVETTLYIK